MTTAEFLEFMNSGKQVTAESNVHQIMHKLSQEAIRITMEINSRYHTQGGDQRFDVRACR